MANIRPLYFTNYVQIALLIMYHIWLKILNARLKWYGYREILGMICKFFPVYIHYIQNSLEIWTFLHVNACLNELHFDREFYYIMLASRKFLTMTGQIG